MITKKVTKLENRKSVSLVQDNTENYVYHPVWCII